MIKKRLSDTICLSLLFAIVLAISAFLVACEVPAMNPSANVSEGQILIPETPAPEINTEPAPSEPVSYSDPNIPANIASGINVEANDKAIIDYSNIRDGYVMAEFRQQTDTDIRVILDTPDGVRYTYTIFPGGGFGVFPLSGGDGKYNIAIYEKIEGTKYALVISTELDVVLTNPFVPFLRPNQFVNYDKDSKVVAKAVELTESAESFIDIISAVYHFVVEDIDYDREMAENIQKGYIPDLDQVMEQHKGICFDYAALMTAMLRSRWIPTKMIFGNTLNTYHAWISVYSEDEGWIDNIIFFDGENWRLMDPTFAASTDPDSLLEYIGDGTNYEEMFQY